MDLFAAAREGHLNQVMSILKQGFDIEMKNDKGHSALMIAAYNNQVGVVEYLITQGADVNSVDLSGNSILMGVVFKGHIHIFDLLVQAGARLDYTNNKKQSTLNIAVMFGRRDLIFRINKLQNLNRSTGKVEQIKTWVKQII